MIDQGAFEAELGAAAEVLAAVAQIAVDGEVLDHAGEVTPPAIRTLDAIHLVSAAEFQPSEIEFVSYDERLATAARAAGMTVVAPHDPPPAG